MAKKLLIVEDEPDYRSLLEHALRQGGYEVCAAPNGEKGIAALEHEHPDMVLLDINLPDTDGYEVCRRIRMDSRFAHIPIIMITVQSDMNDIVHGLKLGADDYIHKPFDPKEVVARVEALFRQARPA